MHRILSCLGIRIVTTGDGSGRRWLHLRILGRYTPGLRIRNASTP